MVVLSLSSSTFLAVPTAFCSKTNRVKVHLISKTQSSLIFQGERLVACVNCFIFFEVYSSELSMVFDQLMKLKLQRQYFCKPSEVLVSKGHLSSYMTLKTNIASIPLYFLLYMLFPGIFFFSFFFPL